MTYILSDVHTERDEFDFDSFKRSPTFSSSIQKKLLILAGDIGTLTGSGSDKLISFLQFTQTHFKAIIYVPGNHEYDGTRSIEQTDLILYNLCYELNCSDPAKGKIYFLNKNGINLKVNGGDIIILGTTLWTQPHSLTEKPLRDHRIERMTNKLRNSLFISQSEWLQSNIYKYSKLGKKVWVITHHAPSFQLLPSIELNESRRDEQMYYASNSDNLLTGVDTWIFGHTHIPTITALNSTKLYNNPVGYVDEEILEQEMIVPFE